MVQQLVFLSLSSLNLVWDKPEEVRQCGRQYDRWRLKLHPWPQPCHGLPPSLAVADSRVQLELHGVQHDATALLGLLALMQTARERQGEERKRRKMVE